MLLVALASVRCSLLLDTSSLADSADASPSPNDVTEAEENASTDVMVDTGVAEASDAGTDVTATLPQGVTVWPENGHGYLLVIGLTPITWTAANAAAVARGGNLATLTSEAETAFVFSLMTAHPEAFNGSYGPWLGGRQHPDAGEPDGGWSWVTGEPWTYTAWAPTEPNEGRSDEDFLDFYSAARPHEPTWSDVADDANQVISYIVEFE